MELYAAMIAFNGMNEHENPETRKDETERGPLGDARRDADRQHTRTGGSLPQEDVEDRENVSTVTPEDYPEADRDMAKPE